MLKTKMLINKNCIKLFTNSRKINFISKRFVSALYVTGDKANENYAVLHPFMNFNEVFVENPQKMEENLKIRKLSIDFNEIQRKYRKFSIIEKEKFKLEQKRDEITQELKKMTKEMGCNHELITSLKNEGKKLREQLKQLKEMSYKVEDDFIHDFLNLPNKLDEKNPIEHPRILYRHGLPPANNKKSELQNHLNRNDLIQYKDPSCYYLLNEAANFDLELTLNCVKYFVGKQQFTQIINPDFARKIILEAAASDSIQLEIEEETELNNFTKLNTLHLNGGGSMTSFLGFIAKLSVFPSIFPMKLISSGRQFETAIKEESMCKGLYNVIQSNAVQVFVATQNENEAQIEMDKILNLTVDIFKKFNLHYQIVLQPANKLQLSECSRASIEMYSPYLQEYIEIGYISNYLDFLSKRLLFNFREGKEYKFPHIVGGKIVDTTKLISCLIENDYNLKNVPNYFKEKNAIEDFKDLFN